MARKRRKAAYRRGNQNHFSMVLIVMAVALITAAVAMRSMEMSQRLEAYKEKETELGRQIDAEEERAKELENFRKYTQTKRYVEEVAKDKLGLVYEGEILFKEED